MSEQLRFMADNLLDLAQYPGLTGSADSEASGYEWWHVADWRRYEGSHWRAATANASHYVQALHTRLRAADLCAIDRNSNLVSNARAGNTSNVELYGSSDSFTTSRGILDINVTTVPGGRPTESLGCLTDEDVWLKAFDAEMHHGWRVTIPAMGSGVTQQIGGLWLGKSWKPSSYVVRFPLDDESYYDETPQDFSAYGWRSRGLPALGRRGVLSIGLGNEADVDMIEWQVLGLFRQGFPAWLIHSEDDAPWRAMLVSIDGPLRWARDPNWHTVYRSIDIPFREESPA